MFGSKKPETTQADVAAQERVRQDKLAPFDFHVMPTKFMATAAPRRQMGLFLVILLIIVLIGGGAAAAYIYISRLQAPVQAPETTQQPVTPEPAAPTTQTQQPATTPTPETPASPAPVTTEPTPAPTQPVGESITYTPTLDTDKDSLTDTEEDLYGTEILKDDTDGDGYKDGIEVAGGYSPLAANTLLADTALVNLYTNPVFNYSILYPSRWLARPTDQSLSVVHFQSSTRELVEVTIMQNQNHSALPDWYVANHPEVNPSSIVPSTTRSGMTAIREQNGLVYYLASAAQPTTVYELRYDPGNLTQLNFQTTFSMMVGSFRVTP